MFQMSKRTRKIRATNVIARRTFFGAVFLFATIITQAQVPGRAAGGELPFRLLGDRILLKLNLQTDAWLKETHVVVDYSRPTALELHGNTIRSLRWGDGEQSLKIVVDGFRVDVPRASVVRSSDKILDDLTARFDNELNQIDVAAIIGWGVLKDWALRIDFDSNRLTLTPAADATSEAARSWASTIVEGVETFEQRVYVPLSDDSGERTWMEVATGDYHSWIDRPSAEARGWSEDAIGNLYFGDDRNQELSGMAALRPGDFEADRKAREAAERDENENAEPIAGFEGKVLVRSGLSLLSGYEFELNPQGGYLALTRIVDSNYSAADAAFYRATAKHTSAAYRDYLAAYPGDRNVEEAVNIAFDLGLEHAEPTERLLELVDAGLSVTDERRQFVYAHEFMPPLFNDETLREKHGDLIIAIGEKAMQYVGLSQNPALRQPTQLMLGDRYLAGGDARAAWKVLLAAAFNGDPQQDGVVRHELGRAYEALGRHRRAYSSYRRALTASAGLPSNMRESAKTAMDRLRPGIDPDDPLLAEEKKQ